MTENVLHQYQLQAVDHIISHTHCALLLDMALQSRNQKINILYIIGFCNDLLFSGVWPVSYTHLDVYKRQEFVTTLRYISILFTSATSKGIEIVSFFSQPVNTKTIAATKTRAVSYTHLDVYKRQKQEQSFSLYHTAFLNL